MKIVIYEDIPRLLQWADLGSPREKTYEVTLEQYSKLKKFDCLFLEVQDLLEGLIFKYD